MDPEGVTAELLQQATAAYGQRERLVGLDQARELLTRLARQFMPEHGELVRNFSEFARRVKAEFEIALPESLVKLAPAELVEAALEVLSREKSDAVGRVGSNTMRSIERYILLSKIDEKWKDLLYNMDALRDVIGMRSFAQQDPKLEYKRDATELFQATMEGIEDDVSSLVFRMTQVAVDHERLARRWKATEFRKDEVGQFAMAGGNGDGAGEEEEKPQPVRVQKRPGRNEPCYCGSGRKYKKCHWPN
jgi:preprotein translocase subunit SecA